MKISATISPSLGVSIFSSLGAVVTDAGRVGGLGNLKIRRMMAKRMRFSLVSVMAIPPCARVKRAACLVLTIVLKET